MIVGGAGIFIFIFIQCYIIIQKLKILLVLSFILIGMENSKYICLKGECESEIDLEDIYYILYVICFCL